MTGPIKTYDDCIKHHRKNFALEMELESGEKYEEIDEDHQKLIDNYCKVAYKDKFVDETLKREEIKRNFKIMNDNEY